MQHMVEETNAGPDPDMLRFCDLRRMGRRGLQGHGRGGTGILALDVGEFRDSRQ